MLSSTSVTGSVGAAPPPAAARLFSAAPRTPCVHAPHNQQQQQQRPGSVHTQAGKSGLEKLGAELLDVVTGGPKLRKWYGQQSSLQQSPTDDTQPPPTSSQPEAAAAAAAQQQQEAEQPTKADTGPRDVVLVTDADSPMGELVTLQLILMRANVRVLVRDTGAAKKGFGPYVDPVSTDVNSQGGLGRVMRGVKTVIAVGKLGALLPAAREAGVERVVLLSTAGMPQRGGLAALFQGEPSDGVLREAAREAAVAASGIPHVVVKAGVIEDVPGGTSSLAVAPASMAASASSGGGGSSSSSSSISREDLASAVVAAAMQLQDLQQPELVFEVQATGPGAPPQSWKQLLEGLAAVQAAR